MARDTSWDAEKSLMREFMVGLVVVVAGFAQNTTADSRGKQTATIPAGVPLRVALERRVGIKRVGEPVRGRLVEPVYVFDRMVLPAGSEVEGHVSEIGGVPAKRRIAALLSGNLTPPREVRAQFDTLVLSDGARLGLRTSPSRGTAHTSRIGARKKRDPSQTGASAIRDQLTAKMNPAVLAFKEPGKVRQLGTFLSGMLPYHRQAWGAGTLFSSVLEEPVKAEGVPLPASGIDRPGGGPLAGQEVDARLVGLISSATAQRGTPVEAIVTRPVFSSEHVLLIPEGSRLSGEVLKAQRARIFHRNGKVLFVFRRITLAAGAQQNVEGRLDGLEADFETHVALDSEGATRVSSPKTRFIFPAIAVAVAGLSFHQDYNAQGVPDQDIGGRAESGAVGLGLIGTVVAQASRPLASGIAIAGAGFSIYTTFLARGEEMVLPANTPVKIGLGPRGGQVAGQPLK